MHKLVNGERVALTADEIAAREAEEAEWEAGRTARALADLRAERNRRLAACDWTQAGDSPLGAELKAAWAAYRQALRDIPETAPDPAALEWPELPA